MIAYPTTGEQDTATNALVSWLDDTVLALVPAVMELLGKANWWLPGWLDRLLPARRAEALGADEPTAVTVAVTR